MRRFLSALTGLLLLAPTARAEVVVREIHFAALENNLLGDPAVRSVTIYLPPSYHLEPERRFPVVYLLHGVGDTDARWRGSRRPWTNIEDILDLGIEAGSFGEMIVVMPSCRTSYLGGLYSDSPVHGNLETYIVQELVDLVDREYRTRAERAGRGVAGHSMGGLGAMRIGMRHADRFAAVYSMNGAVFGFDADISRHNLAFHWAAQVQDPAELQRTHFYTIALLSSAHAWSPDPDNPPFYAQLPFHFDGSVPHLVPQEPAYSRWKANMPLYLVEDPGVQANLRRLEGLRFDTAFTDEFPHIPSTNRQLSERMTELGIPHVFEMYNGNHRDQLPGRDGRLHTEVLPFFWRIFAG